MNRALALIGTMAIAAATLAACGGGGDDNDAGSSADTFGNRSSEALRDGTKGAATPVVDQASARASTTTAGGGQPAAQVGELDRKVIITAAISLTVDDLAGTFAEASNIARSAGGFVEESNFSQAVDDSGERKAPQTATLRLRVPASEHGAVVDSLRRMAGVKVAREGQRSQEVTEQYTDLVSRKRNLERSEQQYLVLLGQAKNIQEILTVQEKVDNVRSQIEQIQGRLNVLDDLTELATIEVTLTLPALPAVKSEPGTDSGPRSFAEVFADAWDSSVAVARHVANAAAVLLVVVIWLGLPALLVGGTAVALSRRRRTMSEGQG